MRSTSSAQDLGQRPLFRSAPLRGHQRAARLARPGWGVRGHEDAWSKARVFLTAGGARRSAGQRRESSSVSARARRPARGRRAARTRGASWPVWVPWVKSYAQARPCGFRRSRRESPPPAARSAGFWRLGLRSLAPDFSAGLHSTHPRWIERDASDGPGDPPRRPVKRATPTYSPPRHRPVHGHVVRLHRRASNPRGAEGGRGSALRAGPPSRSRVTSTGPPRWSRTTASPRRPPGSPCLPRRRCPRPWGRPRRAARRRPCPRVSSEHRGVATRPR